MRAAAAIVILFGTVASTMADTGPVYVVPGRPGVPVLINGRDVSYGYLEGDWGLAKNVHVQPTVFGGRGVYIKPEVGHYYPSYGRTPGYGRLEIQPAANRVLPQPAESYHQSWGAQSAPPTPQAVPDNPPAIILAPEIGGRHHGFQQFRN